MKGWVYCPRCSGSLRLQGSAENPFVSCSECGFVKYDNPLPTTVAMIYDKNERKFLFVRRAIKPQQGKWDTVGGFLEPGETAEQCVARETKEELGTELTDYKIIGTATSIYGNTGMTTLGVLFLCSVDSSRIALSEENDQYAWFPVSEDVDLAFHDGKVALHLARQLLAQ